MANTARMAILRAKIEGSVTDLMLKTTAEHVFVDSNTTLATKLATLAEKASLEQLQQTVDNLGALGGKDKISYADLEEALAALIDGKAEATALTEEINRAKAAEEANAAAAAAAQTAAEAAQADADALEGRMDTVEGKVTTLIGSDANKSVRTIANEEATAAANAEKSRAEGIEAGLRTDIDAVKADYLKAADKTELSNAIAAEKSRAEGIEAGLRTDIDAVKVDYLKAADKTELSNAIAAEKERAEAAEAGLQTQINTIMNNPDAEGAINSINEFTQYVADHGEIAEGFRTSIAANTKAIEDHAALAAETYMSKEDAAAELEELANQITAKAVQADWNQSDSTAADFIKNRPFYAEGAAPIVFDVNAEGMETTVLEGVTFYKVADGHIPVSGPEQFERVHLIEEREGQTLETDVPVTDDDFYIDEHGWQVYGFLVSSDGEYDMGGFIVPEGTWFIDISAATGAKLKYAVVSFAATSIKTIDDKFIPDTIARASALTEEVERAKAAEQEIITGIQGIVNGLNSNIASLDERVIENAGKITALEETAAGLGDLATKDVVSESDLDADLAAKVNASSAANHTHANKELLDSYTQTEANLADAVAKKHEHDNKNELDSITAAMLSSWMGKAKVYGANEVVDLADNEIYIQLV